MSYIKRDFIKSDREEIWIDFEFPRGTTHLQILDRLSGQFDDILKHYPENSYVVVDDWDTCSSGEQICHVMIPETDEQLQERIIKLKKTKQKYLEKAKQLVKKLSKEIDNL